MRSEMAMQLLRRIKDIMVALVYACACLFAAAMLAASFVAMSNWVGGLIGFAVFVISIWCLLEYLSRIGILRDWRVEVFVIMVLCLSVQLLLIGLLPSMGQNGMAAAWDSRAALRAMQAGKVCFTHNVRNQYWCNYEILLSSLAAVFSQKLYVGQALNALCCAAVVLPLFRLSERVAGRRVARFSALLVGFSPVVMLYSTMLTSEFLSAALMFYGLFFLCDAICAKDLRPALLPALLCGGCVGLSHLFKSITILFMASLLFVLLVAWLRCPGKANALRLSVLGVAIAVSCSAVRTVGQTSFATFVNEPRLLEASDQSSPLLYEFVLGLNVSTDGIYSGDLAAKFVGMDEAHRKQFAVDMIKRDWRKYPGLMVRKFLNLHGSHLRPGGAVSSFTLSFRDWPLVKGGRNFTPPWVRPFTDCGTMLFRLVFLLGALGMFISRKRGLEFCMPGLFASLVILGFAVIEQLIEGHGRYKTAVYPFYFMVVPYVCVWFEKDNPLYVRIARMVGGIKARMASHEH